MRRTVTLSPVSTRYLEVITPVTAPNPQWQQPPMTQPPQRGWQPPPPRRRRRALPWVLGSLAVLLVLFLGLAALGAALDNGDTPPAVSAPSTPAAKKSAVPAPGDFKLTAKITEQTCYGKAGCVVTWLPVITYTGPDIPDDETWTVTYQVTGVESGTKIGRALIGSTGPAKQNEKRNRTAGEDSRIILKVTGVGKS